MKFRVAPDDTLTVELAPIPVVIPILQVPASIFKTPLKLVPVPSTNELTVPVPLLFTVPPLCP